MLARANLSPPRNGCSNSVLLLTPTYGEYAGVAALAGAEVLRVEASRQQGFRWDLRQAERIILEKRPALVFLCNPNNPTGVYLGPEDVSLLAGACHRTGGLLVLDEAYLNFVEDRWDALALLSQETGHNLVLLRSMTKDYALTGLRLGYCLGEHGVIADLARLQPDWSVNGLAQAAGLLALADAGYLPAARKAVGEAKGYLTQELESLGFRVLPSSANYLLAEVGDGSGWREMLMRRGIVVRDCASFSLPDCIRIGIRSLPDCRRLVDAVRDQLEG